MAVSPGYNIFVGALELGGALLLFFRRTTLLGALLLSGALVNVVAMDFAYRVRALSYTVALLIVDTSFSRRTRIRSSTFWSADEAIPGVPHRRRSSGGGDSPLAKAVLILLLSVPLIAINIKRRN